MNNNIRTIGPMAIFPKTVMSWNIASSDQMDEASLSLFLSLDPKLDILIIGLDANYPHNAPFLLNLRALMKKHKIVVEILPVYYACSVFNFLNAEKRCIAAALIPPKTELRRQLELEKLEGDNLRQLKAARPDQNDPLIPAEVGNYRELNQHLIEEEKSRIESLKPRVAKRPPKIKGKKDKPDS